MLFIESRGRNVEIKKATWTDFVCIVIFIFIFLANLLLYSLEASSSRARSFRYLVGKGLRSDVLVIFSKDAALFCFSLCRPCRFPTQRDPVQRPVSDTLPSNECDDSFGQTVRRHLEVYCCSVRDCFPDASSVFLNMVHGLQGPHDSRRAGFLHVQIFLSSHWPTDELVCRAGIEHHLQPSLFASSGRAENDLCLFASPFLLFWLSHVFLLSQFNGNAILFYVLGDNFQKVANQLKQDLFNDFPFLAGQIDYDETAGEGVVMVNNFFTQIKNLVA